MPEINDIGMKAQDCEAAKRAFVAIARTWLMNN